MTVNELYEELGFYDDDADIVFDLCDDFEPDSVTEDKWGKRTVHLDTKVMPTYIYEIHGEVHIEFGKETE